MTDQLDHTIATTRARRLPDVGPAPPEVTPPIDGTPPTSHAPWPRNAKVVVVILAIATLLAVLGTVLATTGDDGGTADQQEQIELLTAELETANAKVDAAVVQVMDVTNQRAALNDEIADLEAQIADLDAAIATAAADADELTTERVALMAERSALQASLAAAEAEAADLEARLDTAVDMTATLDQRLAVLDVQVGYLLDRAVSAEQERDALLELFPIEFDSSLKGVDLAGTWTLTWDEAYCTGFSTCGNLPTFNRITITETPQAWLRVTADGVFDAGLFEVEGALYAITASNTAAPACVADQRLAHVGLTLYANTVTIADDGSHVIDDLGATYVVDAPSTGTCPAGVAVYSAELTAVG